VEGFQRLVARSGLEMAELCTPGELDVDIVRNMCSEQPGLALPRFVKAIVQGPEDMRQDFQKFLKRHRLSSHVRILARKTPGLDTPLERAGKTLRGVGRAYADF
jgi:hypothetical protein